MQNIDKVAFGVVGVVIAGLCAFALFFGGGQDHSSSIAKHAETISRKEDEQDTRKLSVEIPARKKVVKDSFELGEAQAFGAWSFYRRPADLKVEAKEVIELAQHLEPRLVGVEVIRVKEDKRSHHVVRGQVGDSTRVKGLRVFVEMRPEGGSWSEVEEVKPAVAGGEFSSTVSPEKPNQGMRYEYRLRSEAMSATKQALPDDRKVLFSDESDPILLPPNFALKASASQLGRAGNEGYEPGRTNLRIRHFDYDTNSVKSKQKIFIEPGLQDEPNSGADLFPELLGPGWKLIGIQKEGSGRVVELKNVETRKKMKVVDGKEGPALEVSPWLNPNLQDGEEDDTEDDSEPEAPADDKPKRSEPDPSDLFGGDDDDG